ncbi:MAG: hypothetical protein JNN16_00100 [Nitrospira sp.]|nr:hypothetical protein [Nitrospira sp.]
MSVDHINPLHQYWDLRLNPRKLQTLCASPTFKRSDPYFTEPAPCKRPPIWISKTDIVAYLKLSPTDAQTLFDSASCQYLIDGIEKISTCQLQTQLYPNLIRTMQRHPSYSSIRLVSLTAIEVLLH